MFDIKIRAIRRFEATEAGYWSCDDVKKYVIQSIMKLLSPDAHVDHRQTRCHGVYSVDPRGQCKMYTGTTDGMKTHIVPIDGNCVVVFGRKRASSCLTMQGDDQRVRSTVR